MTLSRPPYFFALALQGLDSDLPSGSDYPQETLFWATDTTTLYVNDGTTFNAVTGGGSGISSWGQVSTAAYTYAGDPTGHITPDAEGDLCIDTATPALYQATGTGSSDWQLLGGSGSGTWPTYSGSGSPDGAVSAAAVGETYADTTNGAVWIAGATGTAGWLSVGGFNQESGAFGIQLDADASSNWSVHDVAATADGIAVQSAASGGTDGPALFSNFNTLDDGNTGAATFQGQVDAAALGPTIPYVTLQLGAPSGPYQTPFVFDQTLVTGGLYGWDGSAYQQVGFIGGGGGSGTVTEVTSDDASITVTSPTTTPDLAIADVDGGSA